MTRRLLLAPLAILGLWFAASGQQATNESAKKAEPEKTDITAEYKEINSAKFAAPSVQFKKGTVTPRKFDDKAIKVTAKGFSVQLPSGAPVPTPTIYKGKMYVGGGFHSKEFYCFDAVTGKLVWAVDVDDDGPSSAVVEDDVCVFNTESCTIFALDAATGKQLWSYWLGDPLTSTPTIAGGLVFTSYPANGGGGGNDGLNPQNQVPQNAPKNDVPPQPKKEGKPAAKDNAAKDNAAKDNAATDNAATDKTPPAASHALACIELKTGKILWQRWLDSDIMSAPVAVDGDLYATSFGGNVYRFKQKDGAILSAQRSRATSAPVVIGNDVYLTRRADTGKDEKAAEQVVGLDRPGNATKFKGEKNEALYLDDKIQAMSKLNDKAQKLDAGNGFAAGGLGGFSAPAGANPAAAIKNIGQGGVSSMQAFQGSRILNDRGNNFNCMGDKITCTDPTNGKTRWSIKLDGDLKAEGGFLASPPASAGGQIFLSSLKGKVIQVDPDKKTIARTFDVGSPMRFQPAIVDGRIYVGTEDGKVVCIDTGDRKLTGWSTWGANAGHTNVAR